MKQPKGHKSGWHKSGAYSRSESLTGSRSLSKEQFPVSGGSKMSGKQEVSHQPGKSYAMHNESGRLGGDKKTFSSGIPGEAPCHIKK